MRGARAGGAVIRVLVDFGWGVVVGDGAADGVAVAVGGDFFDEGAQDGLFFGEAASGEDFGDVSGAPQKFGFVKKGGGDGLVVKPCKLGLQAEFLGFELGELFEQGARVAVFGDGGGGAADFGMEMVETGFQFFAFGGGLAGLGGREPGVGGAEQGEIAGLEDVFAQGADDGGFEGFG